MMRFLISCGGTGGHLSPGIALAQGLVDRGHTVRLLISHREVDTHLAKRYSKLQFVRSPGAPFTLHPLRVFRFLFLQLVSLLHSYKLIRRWRPDVIMGFGSYTTAGAAVAGFLMGYPVVLHEANRIPGRATRALAGLASRIYLPEGVRLGVRRSKVVRQSGLPVRREIRHIPKTEARERLGVDPDAKLLVILGGSQGASALNEWVRDHIELLTLEGIQVYCITGPGKGAEEVRSFRARAGQLVRAWFVPFSDRMAEVLSAADLVVSRAGAGTIAELVHCRAPAVLAPYPYAADNHQWANARFFEQQGGGIAIGQEYLCDLHEEVLDLMFNDWLLRTFRRNLERMDRGNELEVMLGDLEQLGTASRTNKKIKKLEAT